MLKIINYTLLGINYLLIANTFWSVEIGLNAVVQHGPLNRYVNDNWKSPLLIIFLLAVLSLVGISSNWFGSNAYLASLVLLVLEGLIALDYHRMLKKYITDSWYVFSFNVQMVLAIITSLLIVFSIVTSLFLIEF